MVVTLSVAFAEADPFGAIEVGEMEQFVPCGCPLGQVQLNETGWLNPLIGARLKGYVADFPAGTEAEREEAESEKSVPVPERLTVCVLP